MSIFTKHINTVQNTLIMPEFAHLHIHTQYSILDGAAMIPALLQRTAELGMNALAITDHGNMFGAIDFFTSARKQNIKPIIGCEVYVSRTKHTDKRGRQDRSGHHLILLAKNTEGYHNLSKLSSIAYLEGFYYTPRVDKSLLRRYSKGLIASTACLGGEIPQAILRNDLSTALELINEFKDIFGEDFYLELMDHGLEEQKVVNSELIRLSKETGVKLIATNDVHFINADEYEAHKILIRINTGKDGDDDHGLHYTGQEFLKSPEQMAELFADFPEALANTMEIVNKIEGYELERSTPLMPHYALPEGFNDEDEYLGHLTNTNAEKLYGEITPELRERIDYELSVIKKMGFSGYFLIVQDVIAKAREMDVIIGPGRGSAAGSIVSYCLGITRIDPIHYKLLFERFLNPDRVSMPDIDIDFDDEGRDKVINYVAEKYGASKVAQIITFGTIGAKLAVRDVARVLKVPQAEANRIAKLIPERPGITLKEAINAVSELKDLTINGSEVIKKTFENALVLEGLMRHTAKHACGMIIGTDDLINLLPLCTAKDKNLPLTQYEGNMIQRIGLLKIDFLGLKTLTIMKDAIDTIYKRHNVKIDIDSIPFTDEKTFELFQQGDTIGTFQFESEGMRMYLRELKPTEIEDLIAMNALYRPGPMESINNYIRRKHGMEEISYPLPVLEEILNYTYGIMVYQEQIMQIAQRVGRFKLSDADHLRKVMSKKVVSEMPKVREDFINGAIENGYEKEDAEKVFDVMEDFAKYGFNRSHAAAYSFIAFQTAYLKAHYTAEFMAAVLTHNLSDIKKITFYIDECRRQQIPVLRPDINESEANFTVTDQGSIRFGLAAIKGVGENAVASIIEERNKGGLFNDVFDFTRRINLRAINRRTLEALAQAGAFDSFENIHRAQYFYYEPGEDINFMEKISRYAASYQQSLTAAQQSLFGDDITTMLPEIKIPDCEPWTKMEQLKQEKEVTGFYMSGHPLDDYKEEISSFCNVKLSDLINNVHYLKNLDLSFSGIVTSVQNKITKKGKPYSTFILEDFEEQYSITLFSEDFLKYKHFLIEDTALLIKGKFMQSFRDQNRFELKISFMCLLAEAMDKLVNQITIEIPLNTIDNERINKLYKLMRSHKGICPVKFRIFDPDENIYIEMNTPKYRVESSEFTKSLKSFGDIRYKFNEQQD